MSDDNKLIWNESEHSVGRPEMDKQHKLIFSIINNFIPGNNSSVKDKIEMISELIDYSTAHFSSEESMLDDIGYADKYSHALLHDEYNEKLAFFLNNINEVEVNEIHEFAMQWWLSHILVEDMKYKNE